MPIDDVAVLMPIDDVAVLMPIDDVAVLMPIDDVAVLMPIDDVAVSKSRLYHTQRVQLRSLVLWCSEGLPSLHPDRDYQLKAQGHLTAS